MYGSIYKEIFVHSFYFAHTKIQMCDACITISVLEVLHNCHTINVLMTVYTTRLIYLLSQFFLFSLPVYLFVYFCTTPGFFYTSIISAVYFPRNRKVKSEFVLFHTFSHIRHFLLAA